MKKNLTSDMLFLKRYITKSNILLGFCLLLVMFIMLFCHLDCPILHATGISCPGCGMLRAWFYLLHFDLKRAFFYHPLWWLPPLVPIFWLLYENKRISHQTYQRFFYILIVFFLCTYLIRILFFRNFVIRFSPKDGMIFQIFSKIYRFLKR